MDGEVGGCEYSRFQRLHAAESRRPMEDYAQTLPLARGQLGFEMLAEALPDFGAGVAGEFGIDAIEMMAAGGSIPNL